MLVVATKSHRMRRGCNPLFVAIEEMAVAACEAPGEERLAWLSGLPRVRFMARWLAAGQHLLHLHQQICSSERLREDFHLL
jgi:hypothetical protein